MLLHKVGDIGSDYILPHGNQDLIRALRAARYAYVNVTIVFFKSHVFSIRELIIFKVV